MVLYCASYRFYSDLHFPAMFQSGWRLAVGVCAPYSSLLRRESRVEQYVAALFALAAAGCPGLLWGSFLEDVSYIPFIF